MSRIEERSLAKLEEALNKAIGLLPGDDTITFKLGEKRCKEKHSKAKKLATNMLQMLRDLGRENRKLTVCAMWMKYRYLFQAFTPSKKFSGWQRKSLGN